ncbi:MAG: hypothetical protein JWL73_193 [Actinomycetia bacterium]|nr:hypothetical protein [Actinomycetes bacterium]
MRRSRALLISAAVAIAVLASACGGSSTRSSAGAPKSTSGSGTTAATAAPATTTSGTGVDPNAPEVVAPGDIPDTQVFVPVTMPEGYSLSVPEGWARSTSGTTTTFADHYNSISTTSTSVPAAPTTASVQASEVPQLARSVPNFALVSVTTVQRAAGPAVLVTYRAGSAPDPVTGKRVAIDVERYELWRGGKQVTLTLSGARGSDNVDPWKKVTESFAWTA